MQAKYLLFAVYGQPGTKRGQSQAPNVYPAIAPPSADVGHRDTMQTAAVFSMNYNSVNICRLMVKNSYIFLKSAEI